jgi:arginase
VFAPDPSSPHAQNLPLVAAVARLVASRVRAALDRGLLPLVVGGDCTITLGAVAGARDGVAPLGLVYVDGDLDLNVPEESPSGIFDGMVMAHLLGGGAAELAAIGGPPPLIEEDRVALVGYNIASGTVDPPETRRLSGSSLLRFPVEAVRGRAAEAAREAVTAVRERAGRLLVHFDVDVIDERELAASDVPRTGGLALDDAAEALRAFVHAPGFSGLVLTEFNPRSDPDGSAARRLVALLAHAYRGAPWAAGAAPDAADGGAR